MSVSAEVFGTNGVRRTILVSSAGFISISNGIRRIPGRQTSHEASVAAALGSKLLDVYFSNGQPVEYSLLSARTIPFSAIISCPPNTRSCVLSPEPALAYTYPHSRRADWLIDKLAAVGILADGLVACGEIRDEGRAAERE